MFTSDKDMKWSITQDIKGLWSLTHTVCSFTNGHLKYIQTHLWVLVLWVNAELWVLSHCGQVTRMTACSHRVNNSVDASQTVLVHSVLLVFYTWETTGIKLAPKVLKKMYGICTAKWWQCYPEFNKEWSTSQNQGSDDSCAWSHSGSVRVSFRPQRHSDNGNIYIKRPTYTMIPRLTQNVL